MEKLYILWLTLEPIYIYFFSDEHVDLSNCDHSFHNGVDNRCASVMEDFVLVDNTLYGQNRPDETDKKDANANHGKQIIA